MVWTDAARKAVETCISEVLAHGDVEIKASVERYGALPVFRGWTGDSFLAPDGSVVDVEDGERTTWSDAAWTFYIYVKAARKYPNLQAVLPERQAHHETCPDCRGSGQDLKYPVLDCGTCLGLGWLYPDMPKPKLS
jgi:hypothetical protein